jgi:hypothetical protein
MLRLITNEELLRRFTLEFIESQYFRILSVIFQHVHVATPKINILVLR